MSIVMTVSFEDFRQAFINANRFEQFSPFALELIFDHLEELSDSIGEPIELDVIAICCDYSESTLSEYIEDYSIDINIADYSDEEELQSAIQDESDGCIIGFTSYGTVVYQQH